MADTPNMNLTLPVVQSTLGPTYAQLNNAAFEEIDAHDHSPGSGVLVPTAGLNINLDLPLNGFAITEANAITLQSVVAIPANLSVYSSGGELFYKDASGTAVQITVGGAVDAGIGNVTGLGAYVNSGARTSSVLFSTLGLDFSFYYDGTKLGAVNTGDIRLYPYSPFTTYSNFITLKSPVALSSGYALTLATSLPASSQLVQVSAVGQLSYSNTITQPILGDNGLVATPTYSFSGDTDSGMFLNAVGEIRWAIGGAVGLQLNTAGFTSTLPVLVPNGSAASPAVTFSSDTDTGLYQSAINEVALSTAGVQRLRIDTTSVISQLAIASPSINLDGGGAFKVKLFSVGTSSLTSGVLQVAHGLTAANIRGIEGGYIINSDSSWVGNTFPGVNMYVFTNNLGNVGISWNGAASGPKNFYITVHYV